MNYFKNLLRFIARWFFSYPMLGGAVALMIWIVGFDGLAIMGIPDLYLRIGKSASFFGGVGLSFLFLTTIFVGFLLQSQLEPLTFRGYALHVAPLLYAIVIVSLFLGNDKEFAAWFFAGLVIGCLPLFLTARTHRALRNAEARLLNNKARAVMLNNAQDHLVVFHVQAGAIFLIAAALYALFALIRPLYEFVSAPLAICILLIVIVMPYGYVYFKFTRQRMLIVFALIALAVVANLRPRRYRFPSLERFYSAPRSVDTHKPFDAAAENLAAWAQQLPDHKPRLIVIATSGGGIRAAAWTSNFLNVVQGANPNFARHVRIITGASGGMVGAIDFVARLAAGKTGTGLGPIADDALDDVARSLVLHDVPKLFLPIATADRGVALEERWELLSPKMSMKFSDLRGGEAAGTLPSLIVAPTISEGGRRLLISNLDLSYLTQPKAGTDVLSTGAVQLFNIFPEAQKEMTLATAARMSASFPYVSPAAELPVEPRRHLVDAGYYDVFGVDTAVGWIAAHIAELRAAGIEVALIELRDLDQQENSMNVRVPSSSAALNLLGEAIAPFQSVADVVFSGVIHRNNRELEMLTRLAPEVRHFVFENPQVAGVSEEPLSWTLTNKQREAIGHSLVQQSGRINALLGWLNAP